MSGSSRESASGVAVTSRSEQSLAERIRRFAGAELKKAANPAKAGPMAAYMKTDMPFYGVQRPARELIEREIRKRYEITTRRDYEAAVRALWKQPHREEKYLAIAVAGMFPDFIAPPSLKLYERLVRDGAWWDLVDGVAVGLIGRVLRERRATTAPLMDEWIDDDDMWIRRTALISQIGHKKDTDHRRLFRYCLRRAGEKGFFIRKAVGWALREYSHAEPERVKAFLERHRDRLSPLSFREGAKALIRKGHSVGSPRGG